MSEKNRQGKWRRNTLAKKKHSMKVHLSPLDAATLNAIAVQLYLATPHDPHNGIDGSGYYPSPAEAVRWLCRQWRKEHGRPSPKFAEHRAALSEFWALEAVWRNCNERSDPEKKPPPPWRWR
jgi:hypothetical protein